MSPAMIVKQWNHALRKLACRWQGRQAIARRCRDWWYAKQHGLAAPDQLTRDQILGGHHEQ